MLMKALLYILKFQLCTLYVADIAVAKQLPEGNYYQHAWEFPETPFDPTNAQWNNLEFPRITSSDRPSNWLWIKVILPNTQFEQPAIRIDGVDLHLEVYSGTELIYSFGEMKEGANFAGFRPFIIPLPNNYQVKDLFLRIYSNHANIGLFSNLVLGEQNQFYEEIIHNNRWQLIVSILIFAIGLIMAFFFLHIRNRNLFYFSLVCFLCGLILFSQPNNQITRLFFSSPITLLWIFFLSLYTGFSTLGILTISLLKNQRSYRISKWYYIFGYSIAIIAIFGESSRMLSLLESFRIWQVYSLFGTVLLLRICVLESLSKDRSAHIITGSFMILSICLLYEVLASLSILPDTKLVVFSLGSLGVMVAYGWAILRQIVAEKQKEILIQEQINAAKMVQKSYFFEGPLPSEVEIDFLHITAEKIGGDWYGWYYHEIEHTIYVGVGDVSGHGIEAAMVTGLIYASFKQAISDLKKFHSRDFLVNLADLMNNVFFSIAGESQKSMTMSLVEINLKKMTLRNLNLGAPFVSLIRGDHVKSILSRGNVLGIQENLQQTSIKTIPIQGDDIIFIYTDGLLDNFQITTRYLSKLIRNQTTPISHIRDCLIGDAHQKILMDDTTAVSIKIKSQLMEETVDRSDKFLVNSKI